MKKVTHIPSRCVGCMACMAIAPDLFTTDPETGLAKLIEGQKEGDNFTRSLKDEQVPEILATSCLGQAIVVEEVTIPR